MTAAGHPAAASRPVTAAQKPASGAAGRYASLTVVRDGDGYVLGSQHSPDFVAVPEIGGQVALWLRAGASIDECGRRAAELVGEPVDVAGFLDGLVQAGLLTAAAGASPDPHSPAGIGARKAAAGRVLFGRAGLVIQGLLIAAAIVAMISRPQVRPTYADAIATSVPLISIVIIAVLSMALGLAHEFAHVLAAWSAGVSSRVSISRRMIFIVYQTDLTRLWSVPRRSRIVPLLAGLAFDGATVGVLVGLELTVLGGAPPLVTHLIRAAVFLDVSAIAFQFLIFMRTDVYALFVLATGCKHLWATKGALARKAVTRATAEDLTLLGTVGRRETFWARIFMYLYAPGVLFTTWYFGAFGLPALSKIITTSVDAVSTSGPWSLVGAAGAIALIFTVASAVYVLRGLAQTIARLCRQLIVRPGVSA
jgi:putative peptide zinc metalloprotease protein